MSIPVRFRKIVGGASLAAGAVGIPGAFSFGSDVIVLKGIWITGALIIIEEAGVEMKRNDALQLATSALAGAATFVAGSKIAAKLFHLVPGPGTIGAICVNSFLDAFYTYRFLRCVAEVMDKYDEEKIGYEILKNSISLFSLTTFFDDIDDMKECMAEGAHLKALFENHHEPLNGWKKG